MSFEVSDNGSGIESTDYDSIGELPSCVLTRFKLILLDSDSPQEPYFQARNLRRPERSHIFRFQRRSAQQSLPAGQCDHHHSHQAKGASSRCLDVRQAGQAPSDHKDSPGGKPAFGPLRDL